MNGCNEMMTSTSKIKPLDDILKEYQEFIQAKENQWFHVKKQEELLFFEQVPLYYKIDEQKYSLYKPSGVTISLDRIQEERLPDLYYEKDHFHEANLEIKKHYYKTLQSAIDQQDLKRVYSTLINFNEGVFENPANRRVQIVSDIIELIVQDYLSQKDKYNKFLKNHSDKHSLATHSLRVMFMTLNYCAYKLFSVTHCQSYALAALLHDIGNSLLSEEILYKQKRLNNVEYLALKTHPLLGYVILTENNISDSNVLSAVLDHHERINGSGYPYGKLNVSDCAQVVGIFDSFEMLTNDIRSYRQSMVPIQALSVLKKETDKWYFSESLFKDVAYSLANF